MRITKKQLRRIIIESMNEAKNPCWDGYRPGAQSGRKTKISSKTGKRVANCEKISETDKLKEQDYTGLSPEDQEYYAAEDKRVKSAVTDLPKLAKAIELNNRQAASTGGDMADMYENDAYQLQQVHDMSKEVLPDRNGDFHGTAPEQLTKYMSRLDTAVREQIPLNLYNWIIGRK